MLAQGYCLEVNFPSQPAAIVGRGVAWGTWPGCTLAWHALSALTMVLANAMDAWPDSTAFFPYDVGAPAMPERAQQHSCLRNMVPMFVIKT